MYLCEGDKINLAILNLSVTINLLEKRRERTSAELSGEELSSRLLSERTTVTEKFGLQVLLPTRVFSNVLKTI